MVKKENRKSPYFAPEIRRIPLRQEQAFLQSIQTGPIEGWVEDPAPEIEF